MATMEPLEFPLHKLNVAVSAKLLLAMISQLPPPQILQLPELPVRKGLAVIFIPESDTGSTWLPPTTCVLMEALSASSIPGNATTNIASYQWMAKHAIIPQSFRCAAAFVRRNGDLFSAYGLFLSTTSLVVDALVDRLTFFSISILLFVERSSHFPFFLSC